MKFQIIKTITIAFLLSIFSPFNAFAVAVDCSPPSCSLPNGTVGGSSSSNSCYVGLQYMFHQNLFKDLPDLTVGCRRVDVKSNNDVTGWDGSVRFTLNKKKGEGIFEGAKMMGLTNTRTNIIEYGLGWSESHHAIKIPLYLQRNHIRVGADVIIEPDYRPEEWKNPKPGYTTKGDFLAIDGSVEVNTLSTPRRSSAGTLSCAAGTLMTVAAFTDQTGLGVPADRQLGGQTCGNIG